MNALSLLVLRAKNPDSLAQFYSKLGFEFVREQHGNGPVHHSSNLGGAVFEIYPSQDATDATTGTRIGFRVPSIERVLRACPTRILSKPRMTAWGRRAVIQDPEGHKVELVESV